MALTLGRTTLPTAPAPAAPAIGAMAAACPVPATCIFGAASQDPLVPHDDRNGSAAVATGVAFAHVGGADNCPTAVASPTLTSTALLTVAPAFAAARTVGDATPAVAGDVAPVSPAFAASAPSVKYFTPA